MKLKKLIATSALVAPLMAVAQPEIHLSLAEQQVQLGGKGWNHLVFVNIWDSYAGLGPEEAVGALPDKFAEQVKTVWVSPDMNITPAYLKDYQNYFPASKPLLIDKGFQLMQRYKVWNTPSHVLLKDGDLKFMGSSEQLSQFVEQKF